MDEKKLLNILYYLAGQGYGDNTVWEIIDKLENQEPENLGEPNKVLNPEGFPAYQEFVQLCADYGYQVKTEYRRKYNAYFITIPELTQYMAQTYRPVKTAADLLDIMKYYRLQIGEPVNG